MKAPTLDQQPLDQRRSLPIRLLWGDLKELTRLRLNLMVVLTTAIGFALATEGSFAFGLFLHAVLGTTLVAAGSSSLNQVLERETDALMRRTAARPLPSGRMDEAMALLIGVALSVGGLVYLTVAVNLPTALLGGLTLAIYLFVYTPLKRISSLATVVGAIPGAIPPVMGWTAVRGEISLEAAVLFGILFLWQMPHFLAIAWIYRQDYARGGLPMLSVLDEGGGATALQALLYAAALLPVSLLPSAVGLTGSLYLILALILGIVFLGYGFNFLFRRTNLAAKYLMLYSVLYLPALLGAMMLDRVLSVQF